MLTSKQYFLLFKLVIYFFLALNIVLFFQEEWLVAEYMFSDGFDLDELIGIFSATVDTSAWVILLLIFELETYTLNEEKIKGFVKYLFAGIRAVCYLAIAYALYGYIITYLRFSYFSPIQVTTVCSLADGVYSFMTTLDRFVVLTKENCLSFTKNDVIYAYHHAKIITDATTLEKTKILAIVDIINSVTWMLVMLVLEIDVWLQLKKIFINRVLFISNVLKGFLYSVLLLCSVYWGLHSTFLNFWDSFLWILAFAIIERNVFEWRKKTKKLKAEEGDIQRFLTT